LSQTYPNFEVLVIDDGSTDRTAAIVRLRSQQDPRIRLLQQQNAGVAAARNFGIAESKGEYIAPLDADDIWYPQKLEKQVECMQTANPPVGLVYCWSIYLDGEGRVMGRYPAEQLCKPQGEVLAALVFANFLDHASNPLVRRSCIDHVGGYSSHLRQQKIEGCEDWHFYLRVAEHYRFGLVQDYLIGYRQSLGSMSSNSAKMEKSYHMVLREIIERHPEIPKSVQNWARSSFYNYLLGKSYVSGDYRSSLVWLFKGIAADPILLLRPGIYRALTIGTLKLLAQPLTTLIWPDHKAWMNFQQHWSEFVKAKILKRQPGLSLVEQDEQFPEHRDRVWKPYDLMYLRRWERAVEISQELAQRRTA
jgi:glycosyltransferase involved in cell wall biosynthesis